MAPFPLSYMSIKGNLFHIIILSFRIPSKVLKPEDWVRGNGQSWRPQLGFNPNRQQAHLDQSGFRALGYVHIYIFNIINVKTSKKKKKK